jgi:tRNA modification GTPase
MSYHVDDTICAIGTAPGGGARGMVRVSGRDAVATVDRIFAARGDVKLADIRRPTIIAGEVTLCESAAQLPCNLFLWPTSRSYTREPVAELHTIGSPPLLQRLVAEMCRAGARLAEPGEFTLRAFLAGRLDLTRAEAVLGVIDATCAGDLTTALTQLAGGLAMPLHKLREDLLQLLAELEAGLDFVDDDIEFISRVKTLERLNAAQEPLSQVGQQLTSRRLPAVLNQVVLIGVPNVGKSSLFNAIVREYGNREVTEATPAAAALVSPQRGTTRDYLTSTISLDGVDCVLVDTAGVEDVSDETSSIESAAQVPSADRRRWATVRVVCVEATACKKLSHSYYDIIALTKADLVGDFVHLESDIEGDELELTMVATSSRTGAGIDDLCRAIRNQISRETSSEAVGAIAATAERCGESVRLAGEAIQTAARLTESAAGEELVASELRVALAELGKVVGTVYTDDLLDRIFRTFCIGK